MQLSVLLLVVIFCQREVSVEGQIDSVRDTRAQNARLLRTGTDRLGGMSTSEQHAAFTVTKPQAVALGQNYRARLAGALGVGTGDPVRLPSVGEAGGPVRFGRVPREECPGVFNCDANSKFRTADGSCNNLDNPQWGKSFIPMRRFLPPDYDDGKSAPRTRARDGSALRSAREISRVLHTADIGTSTEAKSVSHMAMQWAQFLDHDLTNSPIERGSDGASIECCPEELTDSARQAGLNNTDRPACFPITIPPGDRRFQRSCMNFVRSVPIHNADCQMLPTEQMNQLTAYVDASQVYESSEHEQRELRTFTGGLLKTSRQNPELLPRSEDPIPSCVTFKTPNYCFRAGDERVDEHTGLASMHTIWLREHNRIARELAYINPHWEDERLFQEARRIVGAMVQHITYSEFLPLVLSRRYLNRHNLNPRRIAYTFTYDPTVDASIRNSFAAAAYRFGHSMIRSLFTEANTRFGVENRYRLRDSFGNSSIILSSNGDAVNTVTRGLATDRSFSVDRFVTPEVSDFLFIDETGNSLDLMSLNIQRGRDHGISGYNAWREWCGLPRADNFRTRPGGLVDHPNDAARALRRLYNHPDDIDLFSGGVSEHPVKGGLLGRTFSCIVARQFEKLKIGDRFWYENYSRITGFTPAQLKQIRRTSLSRVICDNTDTFMIQRHALMKSNRKILCRRLQKLNLRAFRERL